MIQSNLEIIPAFMLGLGSTAHCSLMCGGIMAAHISSGTTSKLKLFILQLGRFTGYIIAGITAYIIVGSSLAHFSASHAWLASINGAILIIVGLSLLPAKIIFFDNFAKFGLFFWRKLQASTSSLNKVLPHYAANLLSGITWGLIPCSMVYSAVLLAAPQNNLFSAIVIMVAFGIGTLPGILGSYTVMHKLKVVLAKRSVRALVGIMTILWGILLIGLFALSSGEHVHHH